MGMLLRNGKQSKQIFKPYDGHDERVKSGRMIRRKVRAGCKRKLQDLSSTEGLSEYDLSLVDKSISSEFEFEDEEEEEVEIIEEQKTTTIGNLFPEILTEIFEKLDVQSRGRAAQVNNCFWTTKSYLPRLAHTHVTKLTHKISKLLRSLYYQTFFAF